MHIYIYNTYTCTSSTEYYNHTILPGPGILVYTQGQLRQRSACFAVAAIEVFTAGAGALTTEEGCLQLRQRGGLAKVGPVGVSGDRGSSKKKLEELRT